MSCEVPPPNAFKDYHDLETLARSRRETLIPLLDQEFYTSVRGEGALQLSEPVRHYAGVLATILLSQFTAEERAIYEPTIHDTIKLGTVLAGRILEPRMFTISFAGIVACHDNPKKLFDYIYEAPDDYLTDRPTLQQLVKRYAPAFGCDSIGITQAKHVTGLTLLQAEQAHFENYLDKQLYRFDEEFDQWQAELGL